MSKKIIVFIGEGNSEIAFFQEFIKNKYKVSGENIKSNILYEINGNFIIFAHPVIGITDHRGGDSIFKKGLTYIDINKKIESTKYCFQVYKEYNFIYLFLTDKDKLDSENKLDGVDELLNKYCSSYKGEKKVLWAIKEIETWFLAGIGKKFIENYPELNNDKLEEFNKKDIEIENDTKEFLKNIILKKTSIGTSQQTIGREFGKYIDIKQAKNKSSSFEIFVEEIDNLLKE